jgi:hypothetical protein
VDVLRVDNRLYGTAQHGRASGQTFAPLQGTERANHQSEMLLIVSVQMQTEQVHSRSIAREQQQEMTQTNYTREISDAICARMSEGESLRAICRDPGMPGEGTFRGWAVRDVDGSAERYRAARLLLMEYWSDQIVDIADDPELDPRDRQIRTAVRQWIMARISPRRWGDKVQLGSHPDSPLRRRRSKV